MKKKIPTLKTDHEAEEFVDKADLSQYDLSGGAAMRFELDKKDARINMRAPEALEQAVSRK